MNTLELKIQFAICILSRESEDLEVWKVYRIIPDAKASEVGCFRVIDDGGEDYLYPASRFVVVELPEEVQARLMAVVEG